MHSRKLLAYTGAFMILSAPACFAPAHAGVIEQCDDAAEQYALQYGDPGSGIYNLHYNAMVSICEDGAPTRPFPGVNIPDLEHWLGNYCSTGGNECTNIPSNPDW